MIIFLKWVTGPGVTLRKIAKELTTGSISGIDHSDIMYNQATKRNKKYIKNKTAELKCGTVWNSNYSENYFNLIYGSNVHFFWENPIKEFQKLYSFLKPDGKLVMVFQPRWAESEDHVKKIADKTKRQYEEAGFHNIEIDFKQMKPVTCIYVSGHKLG